MTAPAQSLHDWHRNVFTRRHDVTLKGGPYKTTFAGTTDIHDRDVRLGTARTVIVSRAVDGLSPDEWQHAQAAFDASPAGVALTDKDPGVRREHCDLWLRHTLYETEHPDLVPASEMALNVVLDHHATPAKIVAHRARIVAHVKSMPAAPPPAPAPSAPEGTS